jgi:hypothetical protein
MYVCACMSMFLPRHWNVRQNHNEKIANKSLENVAHYKYLGKTVTDWHLILEEIERRLNSDMPVRTETRSVLFSRLLSKT